MRSVKRYMTARLFYPTILVFLLGLAAAPLSSRAALTTVLKTCELGYDRWGVAFPCLKIVESPLPLSSYAILREPTPARRTIFSPLADISGIEDPRLLEVDAPNYFAMAWNARSITIPTGADHSALAINAAINRTQDHLHIHIGCVLPEVYEALSTSDINNSRFELMKSELAGKFYWVQFLPGESLGVNPVRSVAEGVPGARQHMAAVTIGVVSGRRPDGTRGFYILANMMTKAPITFAAAEDLLDPRCSPYQWRSLRLT